MRIQYIFDKKYEVCDNGSVFSNVGRRKELVGKISNCGYRIVLLHVKNQRKYISVHRLVAESFVPNPNNRKYVNHKDGDKLNNNYDNLEWVTSKENLLHARDNGLLDYAKIDMETAKKIRKLYKTGNYSYKKIGNIYGIRKTEVGYIINYKRWNKNGN